MTKPLPQRFEEELHQLIDRFLSERINIEQMRDVLRSEIGCDHYERRRELGRNV